MDDRTLIAAARDAQSTAHAPYSEYVVGAALATAGGEVFTGCNVETANYSNSLHAEEVALGSAIRAGHREFDRVAVSTGERDGQTPCGMCRQSFAEFCDEEFVVLTDRGGDDVAEYRLGNLLPDAISGSDLGAE
jgi:cytidine deaminase